jgi:hypothetical protein
LIFPDDFLKITSAKKLKMPCMSSTPIVVPASASSGNKHSHAFPLLATTILTESNKNCMATALNVRSSPNITPSNATTVSSNGVDLNWIGTMRKKIFLST